MNDIPTLEEINIRNKMCDELQEKFDFTIPKYILIELIKEEHDSIELCYLINMAVVNKRFSKKQGKLLKKIYCFK